MKTVAFAFTLVFASCNAAPTTPGATNTPRQDYFALRDGLRCQQVFERTGRGRVAFLGGSITYNPGWRDHVCDYLTARFPNTTFDFVAAGIPSTGSTPGAFRIARDVFAHGTVDLLFEEAAVNDATNGRSVREQQRAMEGIVRHALRHNPAIDVVLMHFVDPSKMRDYRSGRTPDVIRNHERVAAHYRLPSLDLAREVTERIDRGEFTWQDDFRNLHPSPFGQRVYSRAMCRMLDVALREPPATRDALPAALDPTCYDRGELIPPTAAIDTSGFVVDPDWQNHVGGGTRAGFVGVPMLVGTQAGERFSLAFAGRAIGLFVAAGPDAGTIEYRIDDGPWRSQDLFTRWSRGLHLPWLYVLDAELDSDITHRLDVRIAAYADSRSRGHACRIVHFAVNR